MTKCYACKKKVIVNEVGGQAQFFHNISGTTSVEQDLKVACEGRLGEMLNSFFSTVIGVQSPGNAVHSAHRLPRLKAGFHPVIQITI